MPAAEVLRPFLQRQDGAVTFQQAYGSGLSRQQVRTLLVNGWSRPTLGVLVEPEPADAFRAGLRAALLACPDGAACHVTAARLHQLSGLPRWIPSELPQLLVPGETKRAQRAGMRTSSGLRAGQASRLNGFCVTGLSQTVAAVALTLRLDDLVCLLDSALRNGWHLEAFPLSRRCRARLQAALLLADERSESALETLLRLLLVRAGLPPETLQLELTRDGYCYARLDLAWPSQMLAVEADGREHHDKPAALYRDRRRQNDLVLAGWTVLRFTWYDVIHQPQWVAGQVRAALAGLPKG